MFNFSDLEEELLWRTEHELARLAQRFVEADDPNLLASDARRALAGRELRSLREVVEALRAAGDPIDFRPLGDAPVDMRPLKSNLEEFLELALRGIARKLASRSLARESAVPEYEWDGPRGTSLGPFVADPVLAVEVERAEIVAQLNDLAVRGDRLWERLGLGPTNEARVVFGASVAAAVEHVKALEASPGDAPEFSATAFYGAEKALSIIGARGKEFIVPARLLAAIVLELAGLTERRVGPTEDIDGARVDAVRRAVYRHEHRDVSTVAAS